jgi:ArsR family transcriptional regulator
VRRKPLSDASAAALAETFRALGDLTRVRMLDALARSELCVQDLAARLNLTESAVSHQLRLLRNMRLVRTRRAGRMVFYALDDQHIVGLFEQGLEHVEERDGVHRAKLMPSTSVPAGGTEVAAKAGGRGEGRRSRP